MRRTGGEIEHFKVESQWKKASKEALFECELLFENKRAQIINSLKQISAVITHDSKNISIQSIQQESSDKYYKYCCSGEVHWHTSNANKSDILWLDIESVESFDDDFENPEPIMRELFDGGDNSS